MTSSFDDPLGTPAEEQSPPAEPRDASVGTQSETAFLKRLLEALPYPVSYIDTDLIYRQCNAAAAATVGRTPDEVIGQSVAAVAGADSEVLGLLRQVLMSGEPHVGTVEFTAPGSSGTAFFRVSYLPDIDAEGRVIGVLTNVVEVTDLVRSEQALRTSEDRLRRIARAGRIGFVEYNVASDEAYWSPEHYELFGFEVGSQADWQRWLEGVHPEDRERIEANAARLLERAAAEGRVRGHTDEYRYVRPDGTVAWIEADMAVDMVDGQPIMRGVVRDATERKRTEEARQESEERNAFLLQLADALRPLADPVAVQETAARLLGEHLEADRAAYFEIRGDDYVIERDWAPTVPHLSGRFPLKDFGEPLLSTYRAGRMVVMNDVAEEPLSAEEREAFAEVRVAAQISIPLVKSGELVGGLSVHSATPRMWTSQQMRLLEETAERTWAAVERAKAEAEQRRAEQAQRESEERLQIATKATALGIHDFDVRTGTIQWDARVHEMWGVPPDEPVTYETFMGGIDPDQHVRIQAAVDAALDPDGTREFRETYRVISRDGTRRWVSATGRVVFEGGQAVRIIGTAEDVTSRVEAQQALQESEERYRQLFESESDALLLIDQETGRILEANQAAQALYGYDEGELQELTDVDLSAEPEATRAAGRSIGAGDGIAVTSGRHRRKDGSILFVEITGRVFMLHGHPVRIATVRDVGERIRAEAALRESESRFRSLFESSPDAVFLTVPDGTILAANPAACILFGRSEEELLGVGRSSVLDESDARLPAALEKRQRTGQVRAVELTAIRANGERFPAEVESVIVAGEPERSFVILRDITERKLLEGEKDLLLEAARSLTESILLPDVLDQLARITLEVGGHSRVVISLWQEELGCLTVARSRGAAALPDGMAVAIDDLSAPARQAIEKNETRLIDYDAMEPGRRGLADGITTHLALDVPLVFGGRFVGIVATDDPGERREFSERQIRLIEGIAAHASVAIENARLFEAEQEAREAEAERAHRLAMIHEIGIIATGSLNAETVAQGTLDAIARRFDLALGTIFVADEASGNLVPLASVGYPEGFLDTLPGFRIDSDYETARVYRSGTPVAVQDIDSESVPAVSKEAAKTLEKRFGLIVGSYLSFPLKAHDKALGILHLQWATSHPFTKDFMEFVESVGQAVAIALENARLYEAKEDELSRTTILREVAAAAAATIDQRELSVQLLGACRRRLGAKAGNVYVIDREAGVLRASALFGFPEELMPQLELMELDEARASARSYLRSEVVMHDSPDLPSGISERAKAAGATQDRWVTLPIRARGEVAGSFGLVFSGQRAFAAEEIALYQAFADQLGVGLDKARLFEGETAAQVEHAAREERARLARDLHDSVTQSLFAATLKAEALTIAAGDQAPGMTGVAEELGRLSRGALAQMRTMLLELRGDPVHAVPIHQLLRNLVEAAESRASVKVGLDLGEDGTLPADVHEAVYRITQEALNNVTRHAGAQNAWVELGRAASHARLVIGDDGCGFDPDSVEPGHFGLKSIRERADDSGGQLSLRSVLGEGTALTVEWRLGELARKGPAG